MATVKKSKKKFVVPICIILVIAIVTGSIVAVAKSKSGEKVSLYSISTGDIYEKVSLTGDVTSGARREYKVGTVATVKEVFVKVGDEVKKGDNLVSFDTTKVNDQVASLQTAYDDSVKNYNNAVKSQEAAVKKTASLKKEIDKLEKQIKKLQKKVDQKSTTTTKGSTTNSNTTSTTQHTTRKDVVSSILNTTTTAPTTTTKPTTTDDGLPKYTVSLSVYPSTLSGTAIGSGRYPQTDTTVRIKATANAGYEFLGWYTSRSAYLAGEAPVSSKSVWDAPLNGDVSYVAVFIESNDPNNVTTTAASINDVVTALKMLNDNIASITDDVQTMTKLVELVATSISGAISSGQLNNETIAKLVGADIQKAIQTGMIDSAKFLVESDIAVKMVQTAVESIDFEALAKNIMQTDNVSLTSAQIQLAALNAQYEIYKAQADSTVVDAQKSAMTATKKALDAVKAQKAEMDAGWKADFDGVITALDVTPGADTSMISTGLVLENLDSMVVTVSLGEYDVHKVKVGMPAVVTTAYGTYEGEVATIAPTATGGSSNSMLDSVGSMAGISGLSSLTASGAGVECTIFINEPDKNIIVGFDADVEIETGEYLGVTVVPIESIKLEKTGSYVYVYNEEEETVTKTEIKTGAISDTAYQVTSGLKVGDKIVATPSSDYEEDTFKVKIEEK